MSFFLDNILKVKIGNNDDGVYPVDYTTVHSFYVNICEDENNVDRYSPCKTVEFEVRVTRPTIDYEVWWDNQVRVDLFDYQFT